MINGTSGYAGNLNTSGLGTNSATRINAIYRPNAENPTNTGHRPIAESLTSAGSCPNVDNGANLGCDSSSGRHPNSNTRLNVGSGINDSVRTTIGYGAASTSTASLTNTSHRNVVEGRLNVGSLTSGGNKAGTLEHHHTAHCAHAGQATGKIENASNYEIAKDGLCVGCQEPATEHSIQVSCQHKFCPECITDFFDAATKDESLFPPKCCGKEIPMSFVLPILSLEKIALIEQKRVEFSTTNRTYCPIPNCAAFIPLANIHEGVATCPSCLRRVCAACKLAAHDGQDCPEDQALQATLLASNRAGWQRCYECRTMVELTYGCNHISCVCGAEFCYQCGKPWKTCGCPLATEARILGRVRRGTRRRRIRAHPEREDMEEYWEFRRDDPGWRAQCRHQTEWRGGINRRSRTCEDCRVGPLRWIYWCSRCGKTCCYFCRAVH
ncbi:hypothetical protein BDY21DRAFT_283388 [Lineolata rhizophorae]|uniref:RBR-type E3 ubiquitin transferase n=1 Tax=Lineolata rhizophorae TaxID=578093 RepID=A0A6A6P3G7_9PEZI|nr:hypothetical protein BDY21DRAFT_283388 [Lineolata rhizophorae]